MKFFFMLLFIPIFLSAVAFGEEAQVTAVVDRNQISVGDVIHLTISVKSSDSRQIEEPRLNGLDGFDLINTSSGVETRSSFINGRFLTEQSRHFTYMLAANKKGTLTIPPVTVNVDAKTYRTEGIKVVVGDAPSGQPMARQRPQRLPNNPFDQLDQMEEEIFHQMLQRQFPQAVPGQPNVPQFNPDEAFFIQAETDKTKVFVGEQVTTNFYLYTRGQIRDIDTLKYPDLKGFWKEDLEMATRLNFEQVVLNGLAYQRALLVSYALFPIKPGKSIIDPYKAKCTVISPSNFGFGRPYQFTKASRPITIEVADVPVENRPSNYTGAVGNFRVTAQFEPTTGVANQPITLRVRFEGRGNAKLIELPKLELPPSFELYDQKSQAKYIKDGTSFKEFEVLIIPREPGVFQIPGISIGVFDPQAGKFSAASSNPLQISVTGTALAQNQIAPQAPGTGAVKPSNPNVPQLPSLATELGVNHLVSATTVGFTGLLYFGVFAFLGYQAWNGFRRKPKRASLGLILRNRLRHVHQLANNNEWRRVGVELTNAAYLILGQLSEQGVASQELKRLLEGTPPSLRNELAGPIEKLLAQCEALSFAPQDVLGDMTDKAKLDQLIADFQKVMSRAIELAEI